MTFIPEISLPYNAISMTFKRQFSPSDKLRCAKNSCNVHSNKLLDPSSPSDRVQNSRMVFILQRKPLFLSLCFPVPRDGLKLLLSYTMFNALITSTINRLRLLPLLFYYECIPDDLPKFLENLSRVD